MTATWLKLLVQRRARKLLATIDGALKPGIRSLGCLRTRGWQGSGLLLGRGSNTILSGSRSFRGDHGLCLVHGIIICGRAIAYGAVLHPLLLQLRILHLVEVECRGGRGLHEGHGRVTVGVEGPIVMVRERLGIVQPILHAHIDVRRRQPICSQQTASAYRPATMASFNPGQAFCDWDSPRQAGSGADR